MTFFKRLIYVRASGLVASLQAVLTTMSKTMTTMKPHLFSIVIWLLKPIAFVSKPVSSNQMLQLQFDGLRRFSLRRRDHHVVPLRHSTLRTCSSSPSPPAALTLHHPSDTCQSFQIYSVSSHLDIPRCQFQRHPSTTSDHSLNWMLSYDDSIASDFASRDSADLMMHHRLHDAVCHFHPRHDSPRGCDFY